jgi:hypothetical protein
MHAVSTNVVLIDMMITKARVVVRFQIVAHALVTVLFHANLCRSYTSCHGPGVRLLDARLKQPQDRHLPAPKFANGSLMPYYLNGAFGRLSEM